MVSAGSVKMNIVNDILVNTLFPDTDFVQTLAMNSVVPKYVENQEKGNPSVCKNCAEAPFRDLHIYGRSEQKITNGYQLIDHEKINASATVDGVTYTNNGDGSITVNGTATRNAVFEVTTVNLQPGTYRIRCDDFSDSNKIFCAALLTNSWTNAFVNSTFTIQDETLVYIKLVVNEGNTARNLIARPILSPGTGLHEFEPYTGGKPSPSPDYPQEIQSAGDDGNLNVMVRGKNIFGGKFHYASYSDSILLADKWRIDKEVELPYQPERETYGICKVLKCQKGKTYVLSVTNPNKNATIGMTEFKNIENIFNRIDAIGFVAMTNKTKQLYTAKSDGILICGIAGEWTNGSTTTHECTESELLQVEEASEATSYEPYHEPQSMSVTTPNGLPGIPVTSGGNYTDENGQQWICDEVDFGRGVYVQRIEKANQDAFTTKKWSSGVIALINMNTDNIDTESRVALTTISSEYRKGWDYTDHAVHFTQKSAQTLVIVLPKTIDTVEQGEAIRKRGFEFYYQLATPIESPLTTSEIAAYKSLRTYKGTTIVEAEDKAGISVKYNMPMPELSKNGALRRWFKRHPII